MLALLICATLTAAPATLKVRVKSATIEMGLEQYVAAVLAGECSTFRSDEAIKAMAVAARSYALHLRGGMPRKATICAPRRIASGWIRTA